MVAPIDSAIIISFWCPFSMVRRTTPKLKIEEGRKENLIMYLKRILKFSNTAVFLR